jgi:hypothetical protein
LVETVSFFVSSVINAIPAVAGAVTTSYLLDASVTQAMLAAGVAGKGPAFSAWQSSSQTLSCGVATKIQCQTEEFDTANCYDNTTNFRFTPNVAGYYQFNAAWTAGATASNITVALYKNGAEFKRGQNVQANAAIMTVSALIYLNGTTDYVEFYATTQATQAGALALYFTYFQGVLVRAA